MTESKTNFEEFTRLNNDFSNCVDIYFKLSNINMMKQHLNRKDTNLFCISELNSIRHHALAKNKGLSYNNFVELTPEQEIEIQAKMDLLK